MLKFSIYISAPIKMAFCFLPDTLLHILQSNQSFWYWQNRNVILDLVAQEEVS
jgi:hypothetical protein